MPEVEASARDDTTNLDRNENVDDGLSESSDESDSDKIFLICNYLQSNLQLID